MTPSRGSRKRSFSVGVVSGQLAAVWDETRRDVEHAVDFAETSPYPDASTAMDGLFAPAARHE